MRLKRYQWVHILLLLFACFAMANKAYAQKAALDGLWLQIDDGDGRPLSIIRLRSKGELLTGNVAEIFLPPGMQEPKCAHCEGNRAGKPIRGMQILSVKNSKEREWGGVVFDPVSGKEYKCLLKLDPDGNRLYLRGYVGIPSIGRTQIWRRFGAL